MRRLAIVLFAALASVAIIHPTAAESPVSIDGRVVNGTTDGGDVPAIDVTLNSVDSEGSPTQVATVAAGTDGAFHFEDVDVDASQLYFVSARYGGVDYWSEPTSLDDGQSSPQMELAVYETTQDPANLAVELGHVAVDVLPQQKLLQVVQYAVLTNEGDRTYVADSDAADGESGTRLLSLPAGATGVSIVDAPLGASLTPDGLAVVGSQPILPGALEVAASYHMSYAEDSQLITLPIDYPVRTFAFLVSDTGLSVESDQLAFESVANMGDKDYVRMGGGDLAPGETLTVQLLDLPQAGEGGGINNLAMIMIGLAAAVVLAVPYLWWQRLRRRPAEAPASTASDREALLLRLAELEERFDAGSLSREEYMRLRAAVQDRLSALSEPGARSREQ